MNNELIKIAITGPESSGKTTLSRELANYYNSAFVSEFARKYLLKLPHKYNRKDITHIAERQMQREEIVANCIRKKDLQNKILFCDTELINIKIWLEDKGWEVPTWIEEKLLLPSYHYYFLLNTDLIWEKDALRENPLRAKYFFERFEFYLDLYKKPYFIIDGLGISRKQKAIDFINSHYF